MFFILLYFVQPLSAVSGDYSNIMHFLILYKFDKHMRNYGKHRKMLNICN